LFIAKDIGKKYVSAAGEKWALRHVGFVLPDRGLVAIRGESGSGKSTLLNILASLERPSEGSVFFNGIDLGRMGERNSADLRNERFGFLFQHFNLLEGQTALYNVMLPLLIRGAKSGEAKKKANALFSRFKMEALASKKAGVLSGGEKQRVALMRSLIGEPLALFADEPTGALDKKNESLVMEALSKIGGSRLVVLVSHNERLIARYGDRVLTLADGCLKADTGSAFLAKTPQASPKAKRSHSGRWKKALLKADFGKNAGKNLLSFVSETIGFTSVLLSLSFVYGSQNSLKKEKRKSLLYYQCSLSEKYAYAIPGSPLKLTKSERPDREKANDIFAEMPSVSIENDYSFFLPSYSSFCVDGETHDPVSINPVFDITLDELGREMVVAGRPSPSNDFSTCVVNEELANLFSFSIVGRTITLAHEVSLAAYGANEDLTFAYSFRVAGVVKEFSFLNAPRIYYSYPAARSFFRRFPLPEISEASGRELSVDDLVDEALGDEAYARYSFLCFAHSDADADGLRRVQDRLEADGSSCQIANAVYEVEKGFSSLRSAIDDSMIPFLVIEGLAVIFIIGAIAYSTVIMSRKESAILRSLGAHSSEVASIYDSECLFVSLSASVFALAFFPVLERIINPFLEAKTGMENLLSLSCGVVFGIPFLVVFALVFLAVALTFLGVWFPLLAAKRLPIAESLRDE
jgi:putative ABC transport system ATP-binding protein